PIYKIVTLESSIISDAKRSTSAGLRSAWLKAAAQASAKANPVLSFSSFAIEIASSRCAWQEAISPRYHSDSPHSKGSRQWAQKDLPHTNEHFPNARPEDHVSRIVSRPRNRPNSGACMTKGDRLLT